MLRKKQKILVLLLTMAFMMTMVSSGMAKTYSDVQADLFKGGTAQSEAVYKLSALGIIGGYPDGTFKPDATITRAEFSKIAVCVAGLDNVASGMGSTPSTFSDVAASDWYNGWVNVAAAQGYVKGYADGTFKPNAQVTHAEVVTVLMRILGYNDNLTGEWPSDYISKAANLDILDDLSFAANKAASRGDVAIMASAVLDQNVVDYAASDNIFPDKKKWDKKGDNVPYSLLTDKFEGEFFEDCIVLTVDRDGGEYHFDLVFKDDSFSEVKRFKVADDAFVNQTTPLEIESKIADIVLNDDDEIIYAYAPNHGLILSEEMEVSDKGDKIKAVGDYIPKMTAMTPMPALTGEDAQLEKWYNYADEVYVEPFSNGVPWPASISNEVRGAILAAYGLQDKSEYFNALIPSEHALEAWNAIFGSKQNSFYYDLFNSEIIRLAGPVPALPNATPFYKMMDSIGRFDLNISDEGEVVHVRMNCYPQPGIVDSVNYDNERISWKAQPGDTPYGQSPVTSLKDKEYFIKYNAYKGDITDLDEDDIVWVIDGEGAGYRGCDYHMIALGDEFPGVHMTGTLEAVKARGDDAISPYNSTNKFFGTAFDDGTIDKIVSGDAATLTYLESKIGAEKTAILAAKMPTVFGALKAGVPERRGTIEEITFNGINLKALKLATLPVLSVDGGEDFEEITDAGDITGDGDYDLLGEEITIIFNPFGFVAGIISDTEGDSDTGRIYGSVIDIHEDKYYEGELCDLVKVFRLNDGKEVTYAVDDDAEFRNFSSVKDGDMTYGEYNEVKKVTGNIKGVLNQNDFVYFNLTNDGKINHLSKIAYDVTYNEYKEKEVTVPVGGTGAFAADLVKANVDTDLDSIKIGNKWYEAEDAVIANIKEDTDSEDSEIVNWFDVEDYIDSALESDPAKIAYYVDGSELKYAVISRKNLSSDSEVAVVKSHGKDNDGYFVTLVEAEDYVKYYVADNSENDTSTLSSGTALRIKWDAGEVDFMNDKTNKVNRVPTTTTEDNAYVGTLDDINNNSVVLSVYGMDTISFLVDEDTKYFDVTDTDKPFEMSKGDLAKGSEVIVVVDMDVTGTEKVLDQPIKGVIVTD